MTTFLAADDEGVALEGLGGGGVVMVGREGVLALEAFRMHPGTLALPFGIMD